ncbi:MAG: hypothetical protein KGN79_12675 [Acidobacteriota bacterium]|nr:hypothetical protein [Acidobacteriota bacterium]
MAIAVEARGFKPADARDDLIRRIESAPAEHAEAVLSAYELLEQMHKAGVLELLTGLLSARDTVVEKAANAMSSRPAMTGLRLALMLGDLLKSIDADEVHAVLDDKSAPSLFALGKLASTEDGRRGMAAALRLLNLLGAALGEQEKR